MTFAEIKNQVMFQTGNDADDLVDYLPHVDDYANEGYVRLAKAWAGSDYTEQDYPRLQYDEEIPSLPDWTHRALADYATWLVYRNGNPQRQQRGLYFRQAFEDVLKQIYEEGGKNGLNEDGTRKKYNHFINIPR